MQLTITDKFSGFDPIAVLRFLSLFRTACDQNGVHEGASLYLFQFFLTGQARDRVVSRISGTTDLVDAQDRELLRSYPQVVHYLLETYATDDVIMDAHQEGIFFRQSSKMTESAFADDLWKKGCRCGNVFTEGRLKNHFITKFLPAIRTHVCNYHTENPQYSFLTLVTHAKGYGKTYRTSRRNADITRGHATPLRKPNQAHLVSSTESDMDASLIHAVSGDVFAVNFSAPPSGPPSYTFQGTTATTGPPTPKYSPFPPRKDVFVHSPEACFLCLYLIQPCDCTKNLPEDALKTLLSLRQESYRLRRSERMYNRSQQRTTGTPGISRYITPPDTLIKAP
ncbi:unnamed protein product [Agarophyton chilense]